jgi:beta-galactosidase
MKTRALLISVVVLTCLSVNAVAQANGGSPRKASFNADWRFLKGDAPGAEQPAFDDSGWRRLNLPHDWAIEGPFDPKYNPHEGGLPDFGVGWYRKHFSVPASAKGKVFSIEFDGAMSNARVWLNGKELGGRPYGYIGFAFDLTPGLKFGADNVIAVRLSPEEQSSRWYPGAGIYRNVWMIATAPVHVARWGTYVTTPEVTDKVAKVHVTTEVENHGPTDTRVAVTSTVLNADGKRIGSETRWVAVEAGSHNTSEVTIDVVIPHRWDINDPYLYQLISTVGYDGKGNPVLDRYTTPFGIRTVEFTKDDLKLNGRSIRLRGVCNHHDLGALGAAVNRRATERQLQIMKSMGVNAIRTSHNPPSPELLEFADKLGLLVMDEAFDMWQIPKVKNGYSKYFDEWSERDLTDMIHRDRNHPSVILWSIGNEIEEQAKPEGWKLAKKLADIVHREDPTRPVTSAENQAENAIKNQFADQLDVKGFNYAPTKYAKILAEHPEWIVLGSETESAVSSRGVYHLPLEKYEKHPSLQLSSYDILSPPWAYIPDVEFDAQEKNPRVLGEFVWTGFDYLGEPTPYFGWRSDNSKDWPARSSYFGIVDLAGFPKDRYYLYQSQWTTAPMVHVLPHWNWAGREGQNIPVMVYTNADEVELFLNGKSLGKKARFSEPVELPVGKNVSADLKFVSKYRLMWQVPYAPGTLRVIAYKGGKQVAADERKTAGAPARIALSPDRTAVSADGEDLSFITVRVEDKDGNLCPSADNLVRFKVSGAGKIEAVDNGNPATVEPFQADYRKAFSGMALLIVRAGKAPGEIRIEAMSEGLTSGEARVSAK